jgi:hypothetical protein
MKTKEERRIEMNEYMRKWNAERMEKIRSDPAKLTAHRAKQAAKAKIQRSRRREEYNQMAREYNAGYRKSHPDSVLKWKAKESDRCKEKHRVLKRKLLDLYGGVCQCCGEAKFEFLGIDHVNGGGREERRQTAGNWYLWLARQPKRDDLRTMCHNCNLSHGHYGYCPHQVEVLVKRIVVTAWVSSIPVCDFDSVNVGHVKWPTGSPWRMQRKRLEEQRQRNS